LPPPLAWARAKACLRANTAKPLKSEETTMSNNSAVQTTIKLNIYQVVTDRIIESLKVGIIPLREACL
jgi:antirestriction protein ArdC